MAAVWQSQCLLLFGSTPLQSLERCERLHVQLNQQPLTLAKSNIPFVFAPKQTGKLKSNMPAHHSNALVFCQLCRHGVAQCLLWWLAQIFGNSFNVCPVPTFFAKGQISLPMRSFCSKEISLETSVLWTKRSSKTVGASLGWPLPQSHLAQTFACWRCM